MKVRPKICFIVVVPDTIQFFLINHIEKLSEIFDVYLVANIKSETQISNLKLAGYKSINFARKVDLVSDIKSLYLLWKYLKSMDFISVHSITFKGGILSSFASYFSHIPNRIHIFTGQTWATQKGIVRRFFMFIDWMIARMNTKLLVDSIPQRQYLIKHKIINDKALVIGKGSISGVNNNLFNPDSKVRNSIREKLNISEQQIVFVFLGRLKEEKGINELYEAFNKLAENNEQAFLLLVGYDEEEFIKKINLYPNIKTGKNFHYYGPTPHPEQILQAGDVFCLPTYREGFGTSAIEASCLGLPVICSDTYGVIDAMIDNETGLRCKCADAESLYIQMKKLFDSKELRLTLGKNGRKRVLTDFSQDVITQAWVDFYKSLIN